VLIKDSPPLKFNKDDPAIKISLDILKRSLLLQDTPEEELEGLSDEQGSSGSYPKEEVARFLTINSLSVILSPIYSPVTELPGIKDLTLLRKTANLPLLSSIKT
jgi:hypothetical protein